MGESSISEGGGDEVLRECAGITYHPEAIGRWNYVQGILHSLKFQKKSAAPVVGRH